MSEDQIFELAEKLADEAFGDEGFIKYSERQVLAHKFYKILIKELNK